MDENSQTKIEDTGPIPSGGGGLSSPGNFSYIPSTNKYMSVRRQHLLSPNQIRQKTKGDKWKVFFRKTSVYDGNDFLMSM